MRRGEERTGLSAGGVAVSGRHGFEGAWIERGTLPALAATALFGSVLIFGVVSRLVRYRGDELNIIFAAVVVLWACGIACQFVRRRHIGEGLKTTAIFFLMTITAALSTIVLAKSNMPYADAVFAAADRALFPGLDWPSFIIAFDQHGSLIFVLSQSYASLFWQPELLLLYFCATGRGIHAWRVLTALTIALVVCIFIFPFCPALGGYAHFGIGMESVPHVPDLSAWRYPAVLRGVRDGRIDELGLKTLEGIVAMPSFHASAALILGWGFWSSRQLRWPFLLLNLGMLVSSVPIGGHYIVDVLAGAAVGGLAILLVRTHAMRVTGDGIRERPAAAQGAVR
jgi:membrane-associated phospholipid phosphatase